MLRITSSLALLFLSATVATADFNALGQRSVVTARAILPPRALYPRQNDFTCASATDTVCADGSGCCPQGAACFQSDGVGLCSVTCEAAQPTCVFNGVTACCPNGDTCGGSLCIPSGMPTGLPSLSSMGSAPTTTSSDTTTTITSTTTGVATVTMISVNSTTALGNFVNTTSTSTTTIGNSATFTLGTPTVSPPLQVSIAAAPENIKAWSVGSLLGLALFGLAL